MSDEQTGEVGALMKILASLNAQENILGKATIGIMYQTGKSVGRVEGEKLDRAETVSSALEIIRDSPWGDVWGIEIWRDEGQTEDTFKRDEREHAWLVWRECPIRQVCLTEGVKQDGAICKLSYGMFAGIISKVLNKKVDIKPESPGPNACKKLLVIRG
ncbi:MAG: hypothetical protein JRJ51_14025 [Deltaproteobacteria bacterium]|nr:hypothetical protein [Deltaproteobacteria bacterium]